MKWSRYYNCCILCGTTNYNFIAKGLCTSCYKKEYRKKDYVIKQIKQYNNNPKVRKRVNELKRIRRKINYNGLHDKELEYNKEYNSRKDVKLRHLIWAKEWRKKHPILAKKRKQKEYYKNIERYKKAYNRYYKKNKLEILKKNKDYRIKHKIKVKHMRKKYHIKNHKIISQKNKIRFLQKQIRNGKKHNNMKWNNKYERGRIWNIIYGNALLKDPSRFSDYRGDVVERDIKLLQDKIKEIEESYI